MSLNGRQFTSGMLPRAGEGYASIVLSARVHTMDRVISNRDSNNQDTNMKKYLLLLCAALTLVGCRTYQGSPGSDYDTERGTARDMRSPGGLDRARGTNDFPRVP